VLLHGSAVLQVVWVVLCAPLTACCCTGCTLPATQALPVISITNLRVSQHRQHLKSINHLATVDMAIINCDGAASAMFCQPPTITIVQHHQLSPSKQMVFSTTDAPPGRTILHH
jgi:hypothetical protein